LRRGVAPVSRVIQEGVRGRTAPGYRPNGRSRGRGRRVAGVKDVVDEVLACRLAGALFDFLVDPPGLVILEELGAHLAGRVGLPVHADQDEVITLHATAGAVCMELCTRAPTP
jgi:hypothetical protein